MTGTRDSVASAERSAEGEELRPGRSPNIRRLIRGVPTAIALATVVVGATDIVTALLPEHFGRLEPLTYAVPLGVARGATAATTTAGILLVLLGQGLRHRKRRAWRAALALAVLTTALHVLKGFDLVDVLLSLTLTIALIGTASQFYASGDPRTRWRAPMALLLLLVASFVLGLALLEARHASIVGPASLGQRFAEVADGLVGVAGPLHFSNGTGALVGDVLVALGAITVLLPAYLLLRPPEPPGRLSADDERRLRELLDCGGRRDSLGYFALRRDKAAIFDHSGRAAISYRVVSGVMLASGDPIGDPAAWPDAIEAFIDKARLHAWVPAVMGCSERAGEAWVRDAGLRALELGDEAVLTVADFTLDGRAMRNVRQMVARNERAGYDIEIFRVSDLSAAVVSDISRQADAWRESEVERGFSMALGRFGDTADDGCVVVTARRGDRLAAVLHFVPWGRDGLSLDLMRRDRTADVGLNERMIVTTMQAAESLGITRVSLNFSVFRAALDRGGRLGAGPILRMWRGILLWASRWFQIESLYRFNAKFHPAWEPRFICYPGAGDLPRIAVAALEAEAFIVWPRLTFSRR